MKKIQQNLKKWPAIIGVTCLLAGLLSSCTKEATNNQPAPPFAYFAVIDASPNAPSADFYFGNTMVNAAPLVYGNYLSYFRASTGKASVFFYDTGSITTIATDTATLQQNQAYSLFLANVLPTPDVILVKDTIAAPINNGGSIRLVDVSPNAPAVDLVIKGGTTLVTNKTYKQASAFVSIPASTAIADTLQIRQTGTTTVLATIPGLDVQAGTVYTVWFSGLSGTTTANIMINAVYN